MSWVKLSAPALEANCLTSRLFEVAALNIYADTLRTSLSGCENIRASISVIPPERQRFRLFLGCSSTNSCSSPSKSTSCSGVWLLFVSSFVQISSNRSVSLKVYDFKAS